MNGAAKPKSTNRNQLCHVANKWGAVLTVKMERFRCERIVKNLATGPGARTDLTVIEAVV